MKKKETDYIFAVAAHRGEIATGDMVFTSKNEKSRTFEGSVVETVYVGTVTIKIKGIDDSLEVKTQIQNALTALFVLHGEKCLNKKFLLDRLRKMFLDYEIIEITDMDLSRFSRVETTSIRGGVKAYNTALEHLTLENSHTV